jgi:hypothetical protein
MESAANARIQAPLHGCLLGSVYVSIVLVFFKGKLTNALISVYFVK